MNECLSFGRITYKFFINSMYLFPSWITLINFFLLFIAWSLQDYKIKIIWVYKIFTSKIKQVIIAWRDVGKYISFVLFDNFFTADFTILSSKIFNWYLKNWYLSIKTVRNSVTKFWFKESMANKFCALRICKDWTWEYVLLGSFSINFNFNRHDFLQFHIPDKYAHITNIIIQFTQISNIFRFSISTIKITFALLCFLLGCVNPSSLVLVKFSCSKVRVLEDFLVEFLCWYGVKIAAIFKPVWFLVEG